MDLSKSMLPSQVMAERGADFVVINPGSANIRIGLGSAQAPVSVPHCVAHIARTSSPPSSQFPVGSIPDRLFQSTALSESRWAEREAACTRVEEDLDLQLTASEEYAPRVLEVNGNDKGGSGRIVEQSTFAFSWTDVRMPDRDTNLHDVDTDTRMRNNDEYKARCAEASRSIAAEPNLDSGSERSAHCRRHIYGEEALRIPTGEPYILRRPMCRGRLNISQLYSIQQVCDDLFLIWDWVLTFKLRLTAKERQKLAVVLVIPETLDNREVKEMITVLLKDLQFSSAVVLPECLATTFGNGLSSGCVVNLGAQVTSVMCIEDGVGFPSSQVTLQFGGEDVSRCLLWVQKRWRTWPPVITDPLFDPLSMLLLDQIKEKNCVLAGGDHTTVIKLPDPLAGNPRRYFLVTMTALNIPPLGLFYPALLTPEEYMPLTRPWYHVDHEDTLDDSSLETSKKSDGGDLGLWNNLSSSSTSSSSNSTISDQSSANIPRASKSSSSSGSDNSVTLVRAKPGISTCTMSLSEAIIHSIQSLGRPDIYKKMFTSLQLVGGAASTRGLVDAVEERVLHDIPSTEPVDTVEVSPNRMNPSFVAWKGGSIFGVLDTARDTWLQREDWVEGGVHVGSTRKYKDSHAQQAQAFWYCSQFEQQQ